VLIAVQEVIKYFAVGGALFIVVTAVDPVIAEPLDRAVVVVVGGSGSGEIAFVLARLCQDCIEAVEARKEGRPSWFGHPAEMLCLR